MMRLGWFLIVLGTGACGSERRAREVPDDASVVVQATAPADAPAVARDAASDATPPARRLADAPAKRQKETVGQVVQPDPRILEAKEARHEAKEREAARARADECDRIAKRYGNAEPNVFGCADWALEQRRCVLAAADLEAARPCIPPSIDRGPVEAPSPGLAPAPSRDL